VSRGRRLALLAVLLAPLGVSALLLGNHGGDDEKVGQVARSRTTGAARAPVSTLRARTAERVLRVENRQQARAALREDAHGEPGPPPEALRVFERTRAEAEPVARRFFTAFSLYEVGLADEAMERDLRATATRALTGELLYAPPRMPRGATKPERAFLGRLEFVPGAPDASGRRLISGELVGAVRRGGVAETIAIELRRAERGWRVSGLGR
jgi:hypothetical protein